MRIVGAVRVVRIEGVVGVGLNLRVVTVVPGQRGSMPLPALGRHRVK